MFTILFLGAALIIGVRIACAEDPLTVGPEIYKLKFENERVRIMDITFTPGAKIDTHSHPDHIAVIIAGGQLTLGYPDGTSKVIDGQPGDAFFIPAEAHSAVNTGTTEVKGVVIELKETAPALDNADRASIQ